MGVGGTLKASKEVGSNREEKRFQTHLLSIRNNFENALGSLKLSQNYLFFIDGIDIRPATVPYSRYLDCVKGLANAVWSINNDFFPSIKDTPGRLRAILLVRPDIFNSLGLQNRNTKLRDNSVVLNWNAVYYTYRHSDIFRLADRLLSAQQQEVLSLGTAWDHYFPFEATNVRADEAYITSFIAILRLSFHRPRDVLTILEILGNQFVASGGKDVFEYKMLHTPDFSRTYGEYLLGEIKDSLAFYYDEKEFELFLKFFEFLDGKQRFCFDKFLSAFGEFSAFLNSSGRPQVDFMQSPLEFLQFLYEQNVLCYIEEAESERFIRWCFRERTPNNISPKVKEGMYYELHEGLANVLNTGRELRGRTSRAPSSTTNPNDITKQRDSILHPKISETFDLENTISGRILFFDTKRGFGFIRQSNGEDVHFQTSALASRMPLKRGMTVLFQLNSISTGKVTAIKVRPVASMKKNG